MSFNRSDEEYIVAGTGTGIGKTIISAILCQALEADYWKPIQAGNLEQSDSELVRSLVSNDKTIVHPESFRFTKACSPHLAAALDGIRYGIEDMALPVTDNSLVVEGAGGLLVPINESQLVIDLIGQLGFPVLLVSKNYLGSINHTLLSIEALRSRSIPIIGLVFNGPENPETEKIILKFTKLNAIARVFEEESMGKAEVARYVQEFKRGLDELS